MPANAVLLKYCSLNVKSVNVPYKRKVSSLILTAFFPIRSVFYQSLLAFIVLSVRVYVNTVNSKCSLLATVASGLISQCMAFITFWLAMKNSVSL